MPHRSSSPLDNQLLASLPAADRGRLLAGGKVVELRMGDSLIEPGEVINHVYFPTSSFISLISPLDAQAQLEVGLVGREGMLGASLVLGVNTSPLRGLVQGEGAAWRLGAAKLRREISKSRALHSSLSRYVFVLLSQFAQTAACNRFHVVDARVARWLLMTRDRAGSDEFELTHQWLAYILGSRRAGITRAASSLQERKLIRYSRGHVEILNTAGLERAACTCYATAKSAYASLLH